MSKRVRESEQESERVRERVSKRVSKRARERVSKRSSEKESERVKERTRGRGEPWCYNYATVTFSMGYYTPSNIRVRERGGGRGRE